MAGGATGVSPRAHLYSGRSRRHTSLPSFLQAGSWARATRTATDKPKPPRTNRERGHTGTKGAEAELCSGCAVARTRVSGVQSKCKLTFFWGGWQKIVAQIRGVFQKIVFTTPPGGPENTSSHPFLSSHRHHGLWFAILELIFAIIECTH